MLAVPFIPHSRQGAGLIVGKTRIRPHNRDWLHSAIAYPPTGQMNDLIHPAGFQLVSPYLPAGDQPQAIEKVVEGLRDGFRHQTLLGVTGSGKTMTAASVIAQVQQNLREEIGGHSLRLGEVFDLGQLAGPVQARKLRHHTTGIIDFDRDLHRDVR